MRNRQHIIVGHAPGRGANSSRRVLDSQSGSRLAAYAGTTLEDVLSVCDTVNVYLTPSSSRASAKARGELYAKLAVQGYYRTALFVGADTTWLAFHDTPPFMRGTVFAVPHTSGRCRYWNDADNAKTGALVLQAWWRAVLTDNAEIARVDAVPEDADN